MKIIEGLGWKRRVDEVGDNSFSLDLGDRVVRVIPNVGKRHDHFRVSFMPSVTTREFSEIASALMNENDARHEPITSMLEKPEKVSSFGEGDVDVWLGKIIAWAKSEDIASGLADYRALPTDCVGARPMRHIAALALAGDVEKIEGYSCSFKAGNRLDFVPYITESMLDRAIALAKVRRG
ncbi:DUF6990 domain-containing protein [Ralstonia solanacearum]|uniref:DUF6990 domain-containing protein n=1 Tax=Ralstonia solanacearum TaxID=305 RepID=UPI0012D7C956|nr:hypothetical protein [Ralstonia solanacearum]